MRAHDNCAREPEEADGGHPPDIRVDIIAAIAGIVSRREDGTSSSRLCERTRVLGIATGVHWTISPSAGVNRGLDSMAENIHQERRIFRCKQEIPAGNNSGDASTR